MRPIDQIGNEIQPIEVFCDRQRNSHDDAYHLLTTKHLRVQCRQPLLIVFFFPTLDEQESISIQTPCNRQVEKPSFSALLTTPSHQSRSITYTLPEQDDQHGLGGRRNRKPHRIKIRQVVPQVSSDVVRGRLWDWRLVPPGLRFDPAGE